MGLCFGSDEPIARSLFVAHNAMKIYKPDNLGMLHRNYCFARRNQLAVGMMGFFSLDDSCLTSLLAEAQMWPQAIRAMGQGVVLDEGWAKPAAEFLVFGTAYATQGTPVAELAVTAQIGSLQKSLVVRGNRHFNALGFITAAEPFSHMALSPQNAFGGSGSLDNPLGKGLVKITTPAGDTLLPLPNIEHAKAFVAHQGDQPLAAGFGSYPAQSPQRTQYFGQFDDHWLQKTWPHLPDTTQPTYFHAAPSDQRLKGFFKGDEAIYLANLHPQRSVLTSQLPQLRARCFVNRRVGEGTEFTELAAHLDTVLLFPDQAFGIVLYRAVATGLDEDFEDVLHLLADWEDLRVTPLPLAHYHDVFSAQQIQKAVQTAAVPDEASALESMVSAAPPVGVAAAVSPLAASTGIALGLEADAFSEVTQMAAALEQQSRQLMASFGITDAQVAAITAPALEAPPGTLAEVEAMAHELQAQSLALQREHKITDAQVAQFIQTPPEAPAPTAADLKSAVKELQQQTDATMRQHGITAQDVQKFADSRPDLTDLSKALREPPQDMDAAFASLGAALSAVAPALNIPSPAKSPELPKPPGLSPSALDAAEPALAAKLTRADVLARHAAHQSLAGCELSGLDLSTLDLKGADFNGALLENTRFNDASLVGANFSQALLQGGDFSGADLSHAQLEGVSAGFSKFTAAQMSGGNLKGGDFTGADFSKAQLSSSQLSQAVFDESNLNAGVLHGCVAIKTSFSGCNLTAADLSKADLSGAVFNAAKLVGTCFDAAVCDNAEFYGADADQASFLKTSLKASRADLSSQFKAAQFGGAMLDRANWEGAVLTGAGFANASLEAVDFSKVKAQNAQFTAAVAKGCKFDKADLSGADLSGVNLFKGSLRKTGLKDTSLRRANLYGVDFYGSTPTMSSLQGANIDQTLLKIRLPRV